MKEQLPHQLTPEQEIKYLENFGNEEAQKDHAWSEHRPNSPETILEAYHAEGVNDSTPQVSGKRVSRSEAKDRYEVARQDERLKKAFGDDFGGTFSERKEWNEYLQSRPENDAEQASEEDENSYENSSISQLAKLLGRAEYSDDKTSMGNISDVLIEKMDKVAEGFSIKRTDENDRKYYKDDEEVDPRQAFYNRVMSIKDKEVERLKSEAEAKEKGNDQKQAQDKAIEDAKSDGDEVMDLGGTGIIIGSENDMPPVIKSNQEPNMDVDDLGEAGVLKDEGLDDYENEPTQPMPSPEPKTKKGLWGRIKDAWNKDPAVRFDGVDYTGQPVPGKRIGEAIVDTRDREYETRHKVALVALGVAAVGLAYLMSKHGGGVDHNAIIDHIRGGGKHPDGASHSFEAPAKLGTIEHAKTAKDVVNNALHENFNHLGYKVGNATPENVAKLVDSIKDSSNHINLIVGEKAGNQPNVVSAALDLKDGLTGNAYASQQVAIDPGSIDHFMDLAKEAGITITKK